MAMVEAQEDTTDGDGAKVTVFVFRDGKTTGCGKEWDNGRGDFVRNDVVVAATKWSVAASSSSNQVRKVM